MQGRQDAKVRWSGGKELGMPMTLDYFTFTLLQVPEPASRRKQLEPEHRRSRNVRFTKFRGRFLDHRPKGLARYADLRDDLRANDPDLSANKDVVLLLPKSEVRPIVPQSSLSGSDH